MILKKKTLKNNTSNRKLISHSNYFRLKFNLNIFVGKLCAVMMNTLQGKGRGGERRGGGLTPWRSTYCAYEIQGKIRVWGMGYEGKGGGL